MALKIKQHDRRPYFVAALQQPAGVPIPDLDTATSISIIMRKNGSTGAPKVKSEVELLDVGTATVRYKWGATDTDTPGSYDVEVEILWPNAEPQTVPTEGYYTVTIGDDLDD